MCGHPGWEFCIFEKQNKKSHRPTSQIKKNIFFARKREEGKEKKIAFNMFVNQHPFESIHCRSFRSANWIRFHSCVWADMFPCVRADLDAEKRERKGGLIKAGLLLISRRIQSKKDIEKTREGIRERCALWSFRNPDDYPTLMSGIFFEIFKKDFFFFKFFCVHSQQYWP